MYFVHLMLPHYPYAYDAECRLRPRPAEWLTNSDRRAFPMSNSVESRAHRYTLYLEQMDCTHRELADLFLAMQRSGVFGAAEIVIHGDHGSRIGLAPMDARAADFIDPMSFLDSYSTLFAWHQPDRENGARPNTTSGEYDLRQLPISAILRDIIHAGEVPQEIDPVDAPTVYLTNAANQPPKPHPMPDFEGGTPIKTQPSPTQ